MLEYYYEVFLIKCQLWSFWWNIILWSFWWNVNNGVSDKIIPTMNKMIKAIKYNVNIAIVDKLFFYVDNLFYWIDMNVVNNTVFIELRERCYTGLKIV